MWMRAVCLWLLVGSLTSGLDRFPRPPDRENAGGIKATSSLGVFGGELMTGGLQGFLREIGRDPYLIDPATLYLLSQSNDLIQEENGGERVRGKRTGSILSIIEPIDVLRNRVMLQMKQKMQRQNENKVLANRLLLKSVGKRQATFDRPSEVGEKLEYYRNLAQTE